MPKQLAILLDASGSMFHPAGGGSDLDKIVEASQSAQYVIDEIVNKVAADNDRWAVSIWRFANTTSGLTGQTIFDPGISEFTVNTVKDLIAVIENQASNQSTVGNMTDIFNAVRTVAEYMAANTPSVSDVGPGPLKRKLLLFTDGNQTIEYAGGLSKIDYEFDQGVDFADILAGNDIALNAQGIGSDLLNYTLTTLFDDAEAFGSSVKVISTTPGYEADVAPALMTNSMKIVNNNGILALRPKGEAGAGLLWEQFALPHIELDPQTSTVALPTAVRRNYKEFEVECDAISKELLLGITWHHPGHASVQATSPSGTLYENGSNGAFTIEHGRLATLHVPNPEPGLWTVRVQGDPRFRPMRLNLLARGINPLFQLQVAANPQQLEQAGSVEISATPYWDAKPADGHFKVIATSFAGDSIELQRQADGRYAGTANLTHAGLMPWRIKLQGKLQSGESVHRIEFTAVQVGRPKDPRIQVTPNQYLVGNRYTVDVKLSDAEFNRLTQIRFGNGIEVKRFLVQNADSAQAIIEVAKDAIPGQREVITYNPNAETSTGVIILPGQQEPGIPAGFIEALKFNAAGQLVGIILDNGKHIKVDSHCDRLQCLLERARDSCQSVTVEVDGEGRLTCVIVGH